MSGVGSTANFIGGDVSIVSGSLALDNGEKITIEDSGNNPRDIIQLNTRMEIGENAATLGQMRFDVGAGGNWFEFRHGGALSFTADSAGIYALNQTRVSLTTYEQITACHAYVRGSLATPTAVGHNVSSLTDNGLGDYTVNLTTANINSLTGFSVTPLVNDTARYTAKAHTITASSVRILAFNTSGGAADIDCGLFLGQR